MTLFTSLTRTTPLNSLPAAGAGETWVAVMPCPAAEQLEPVWRLLETSSTPSAFLSWSWIGSLVELYRPRLTLLSVRRGEKLTALALAGLDARGQFHLNETGDTMIDAIMIEYNGLLALPGEEAAAEQAVARLVATAPAGEIHLSGVHPHWQALCAETGLGCRLLREQQAAPYAHLDEEEEEDGFTPSLSSNSRAQLRRSLRFFETLGPVILDRAEDPEQALAWFDRLETLHSASWQAKGLGGAFARPTFGSFHRHLIRAHFGEGVADLLRLTAGGTELGYLYNLRRNNSVHAYQSGFAPGEDQRWRPGIVAHFLAMRRYRREGYGVYRFLAGDARYKNSFATGRDQLYWMSVFRPSLSRSVAARLRQLKNRSLGVPA